MNTESWSRRHGGNLRGRAMSTLPEDEIRTDTSAALVMAES